MLICNNFFQGVGHHFLRDHLKKDNSSINDLVIFETVFTQSELIEPVSPQAGQQGIHFYYISFTTHS